MFDYGLNLRNGIHYLAQYIIKENFRLAYITLIMIVIWISVDNIRFSRLNETYKK